MRIKILIASFLLILKALTLTAQQDTAVQKLLQKINKETDVAVKIDDYFDVAIKYFMKDSVKCQETVDTWIYMAEESRNRQHIMKAYRKAAVLYGQAEGLKEFTSKAKVYILKALEVGKNEKNVEREKIFSTIYLSRLLRIEEKDAEAKKNNEEAIRMADEIKDDSLRVVSRIGLGATLLAANEKLPAFKSYIDAQTIAENTKHKDKDWILVMTYNRLGEFYANIENYEKALDYRYKSLQYSKINKNNADTYSNLYMIGNYFIAAKKYDAAQKTFEEIITFADSIKEPTYKTQAHVGITGALLYNTDTKKALSYLRQHPEVLNTYKQYNQLFLLEFGLGYVFKQAKQFDSARYYYEKNLPLVEQYIALPQLPNYYTQYATFLYEVNSNDKAIQYLLKAESINNSLNNFVENKEIYALLDSCYTKNKNFEKAIVYKNLFFKAKQEIEEKGKAKEILEEEIKTETKRKEKQIADEAEKTRVRHNWQYMGIVMAIISLFTLLATFGVFNVPLKWVRALGFIAFIFLFEFIILLADTWIHHATHGEPWKVLGIKVVLIALLLPLHHFLEHKAVSYLAFRKHQKELHKKQIL